MVNTSDLKSDADRLGGSIPPERTITFFGEDIRNLSQEQLIKCIEYLMEYDVINRKSYNEHIHFLEDTLLKRRLRYNGP